MSGWIYYGARAVGAVLGAIGAVIASRYVHVNDWTQPILIGLFCGISTSLASRLGLRLQQRYGQKSESV